MNDITKEKIIDVLKEWIYVSDDFECFEMGFTFVSIFCS